MNGLDAQVPRVCVPLSVQSRGARLKCCRKHGNWTVSDWGNVIFTDETRFALEPDDKHIWIWRKQGTRNQPQNITEHHAFRGGSIVVADIVDDYLESEGIARMAWPEYSPDLNPIENLWDALGCAVSSRFPPPALLLSWKLLYKKNGDCA
ncbi:transposable element Tcb1 transposase [Trichonephila clavipes]|nr:transposable element Tcb1 transposase [Trichonephila clavipes]